MTSAVAALKEMKLQGGAMSIKFIIEVLEPSDYPQPFAERKASQQGVLDSEVNPQKTFICLTEDEQRVRLAFLNLPGIEDIPPFSVLRVVRCAE